MAGDISNSDKKFEFPDCWNNDVRMSALFAPFRSKSVNPTDWDSKMKFWTNLIESWCKHNKCPVVDVSSFKNFFSRKNLFPACLDDVIQHLVSTGVIMDKDNFMLSQENWKNWVVKILVKKPLVWTLNTVKNTFIKIDEKEIYYVHIPVAEHLCEELISKAGAASQGKILNSRFFEELGFESQENLSIVLHLMQKQGLADIYHTKGMTLVKLGKPASGPVKITETDLGIYNLEVHEKVLEESIAKLYSERNAALEKTKYHLAEKMKDLAKISLQRKRELEKTIEKRSVTLENIRGILHKIEQMKLDSEIIDTYRKGLSVLKEIYAETGLNPQNVAETVDELQELLNSRSEIDEALARPMDPSLEENLEEELNELLLKDAPDVPLNDLPKNSTEENNEREKTDEISRKIQAMSI